MTLKALENKIHAQIPMTKMMQVSIQECNEHHLITRIPLDININDKGTAFGGSLNSLLTISGWCLSVLLSEQLGLKNANIVILKNESQFLKPVTKDIICYTQQPTQKELNILKEKLQQKKSGSITLKSSIIEQQKTCVEFTGVYVIKQLN